MFGLFVAARHDDTKIAKDTPVVTTLGNNDIFLQSLIKRLLMHVGLDQTSCRAVELVNAKLEKFEYKIHLSAHRRGSRTDESENKS